jgi:flagellar biosynthetic protein FliR
MAPGLDILAQAAPGTSDAEIRSALIYVPTYVAVLIRVGAMFLFAPFFGSARVPRRVKGLLAVTLAATMAPSVGVVEWPGSIFELSAAIAGEMLFGLAMGMVMSLVFVGAQWAGEMIGQQIGFNYGAVLDPQFGVSGTVVSDVLFMLTLVIFLALRGHHAMLEGLHASFSALPPFTAGVGPGGAEMVWGLMHGCTILAIKLTAPVLVAMLVADVVLGFISKTMPQMNVMSIGMSLRSLLGLLVIAAGLTLTSETMIDAVWDSMHEVRRAWVLRWDDPQHVGGAGGGLLPAGDGGGVNDGR